MSKYLNVPDGNYKVAVQTGGTIYLDTGFEQGNVEISGNLIIQGDTTTVNTTQLVIEDRIITLNQGDDAAAGIQGTDSFSGIEINRGSLQDAYFGYDEDVSGFIAYTGTGSSLSSIATNKLDSRSGLLTLETGASTVNVSAFGDYEQKVFTYNVSNQLTGYDAGKADVIPNTQAVVDYVAYNFANVFLSQIGDGTVTPSSIVISDFESSGNKSKITFKIDDTTIAQVYEDTWEFDKVRISGTAIETISTGDDDLVLRSNGAGSIRIDDMLHINSTPSDDDATLIPATVPDQGVKLYVRNQSHGKTGIYFINAENNRDELVSKNRALLFGMLF